MYKKLKKTIYRLLRNSQKWTKTDMVYLAKEGFWLNFGQLLMIVTNLALTMAFANILDPEVYGTYQFVISFIAILSITSLPGMGTAIVRTVAQGNDSILIPALREKIKWGGFAGIFGLLIAFYYYIQGNFTLFVAFLLLALFIPILGPFNKIWVNYLNGKKKFKKLSQYQVITNALNVFIVMITLFITQKIVYILLSYLLSLTITRVMMFFIVLKKYPPSEKRTDQETKKSIRYGKDLSLMNIIGTTAGKIDKILIFHFMGPGEVAIYVFAQTPIKYLKSPLSSFSQLTLPKLSQQDLPTLKKTIPQKMIRMFIIIIPIVIIYIITIPYFFNIFFPQYSQSILYSQVLSLSLLFFPISLISQTLTAHAQKKQLYILNTVIPILKIILFLILLPMYGIWGIVLALIIVPIINFILLLIIFKRIK